MVRWLRVALLAGLVGLVAGGALAQQAAPPASPASGAPVVEESSPAPAAEQPVAEQPVAEPAGAAAPGAASQGSSSDATADFSRELLTVEEQVEGLKERVFRSKATLQLLKEIVIQGSTTGARAVVWHVNDLGAAYTLESVSYYLDGQSIYAKADPSGGLDASKEIKIWDGAIPPGNHNLTVSMVLRGNGLGVFRYVEDITFNVKSSTAFTSEDGHVTSVRTILGRRRGIGRSFTERPNVVYEVQTVRMAEEE